MFCQSMSQRRTINKQNSEAFVRFLDFIVRRRNNCINLQHNFKKISTNSGRIRVFITEKETYFVRHRLATKNESPKSVLCSKVICFFSSLKKQRKKTFKFFDFRFLDMFDRIAMKIASIVEKKTVFN